MDHKSINWSFDFFGVRWLDTALCGRAPNELRRDSRTSAGVLLIKGLTHGSAWSFNLSINPQSGVEPPHSKEAIRLALWRPGLHDTRSEATRVKAIGMTNDQ